MECTGNVVLPFGQYSMNSDASENVSPPAMDGMPSFEEDEVTSPVFDPIVTALSSSGMEKHLDFAALDCILPSRPSSKGREEQHQQVIATLESFEPSNSSNQGQKEHQQYDIASLECAETSNSSSRERIEAPYCSNQGQKDQQQRGIGSVKSTEPSSSSNQGQKGQERQEENDQEQRGILRACILGSGEASVDVSRKQIDQPLQNPSTRTGALDASLSLSGLQISSAQFCDSDVDFTDVHTGKEIFTGEVEYHHSNEEEMKAGTSCVCSKCSHADKVTGQDVFGSVLNSKMLDSELCSSEEVAVEPNMLDMGKSGFHGIDELPKPFQGDGIVSYFLVNIKLVIVLFTNLLLLPKVLKCWTLKKLMKVKALLTLKKSTVEKTTAENFASEGVYIAKLRNERASGECAEDQLVGALGWPLGKSVAIVLAEVMENNCQQEHSISADKLSKLFGLAIRESLFQVLGSGCNRLSRDFEAAFSSTYRTITLVRREHDKQRTSCSSEKKVSHSNGKIPRLATDVHCYDTKVGCAHALRNGEVGMASMGGQFQVKTGRSRHIHENSCCPGSAWEHRMKVGGQESCKPSFMKPDTQVIPKISHVILNYSHADSKDLEVTGHEHKVCGATSVVDEECNNLDHGNSCVVNGPIGNGHLSYSKAHFSSGENEESIPSFEDVKIESEACTDSFMEDLSFVATNKTIFTGERIEENECKSAINDHCDTSGMLRSSLNQQVVLHGQYQQQLTNPVSRVPCPQWQHSMCNVFERSVREQARCNDLKAVEIGLAMRHIHLKEAQMCVDSVSNDLRRQKISLNQSKASFKKSEFTDQKLTTAYVELSRTCADELVAGLVLMLLALAYGGWNYSYVHLSEAAAMCQPSTKGPQKSAWFLFYKPVDYVTGHFHTILCQLTVFGRMFIGLAVIAIIAYSLLRHTVTSSSQAMPATVILILLGCFGGWAGKFSVDSLGGSGFHWLVLWEVLCLFHAFSACFTSTLFCILNGPASSFVGIKEKVLIPFWIRRLVFHTILLLLLPVMAGLTPFASVRDWAKHFSVIIFDGVVEPVRIYVRDNLRQFSLA